MLGQSLIRRGGGHKARTVSLSIFVFGAVLLLSMSAIFHLLPKGADRDFVQRLDHAAIFVLIAATFTPVQVILFRGRWRWGMLTFVWTLAALGITLKSMFFTRVPEGLGVGLYVGMGWVGVVSGAAMIRRQGWRFLIPMLLGGVLYTGGALCDLFKVTVLIPGVLGPHEIFHFAVLGGLGLHWYFIWSLADGTKPVVGMYGEPPTVSGRAAA